MIDKINWKQIKQSVFISFIFSFIFFETTVVLFLNVYSRSQGQAGYGLAIYLSLLILLIFPISINILWSDRKVITGLKLLSMFAVGFLLFLIIGYSRYESTGNIFTLTSFAGFSVLLPIVPLARYKKAKLIKYVRGLFSSIVATLLSILAFAILTVVSAGFIMGSYFNIVVNKAVWMILPALIGTITAALYWFVIRLTDEINRIKYESND